MSFILTSHANNMRKVATNSIVIQIVLQKFAACKKKKETELIHMLKKRKHCNVKMPMLKK